MISSLNASRIRQSNIRKPLVLWLSPWHKRHTLISRIFAISRVYYIKHVFQQQQFHQHLDLTIFLKLVKLWTRNQQNWVYHCVFQKIREMTAGHLYQGLDQSTKGFLMFVGHGKFGKKYSKRTIRLFFLNLGWKNRT